MKNSFGPIAGICAFGGSAVLISLVKINYGGVKDAITGFNIVSSWFFYLILGYLVTLLAQEQRSRDESF